MAPTLMVNDHILANMQAYQNNEPKFGDILQFRSPPQSSPIHQEFMNTKRVIGIPGDVIEMRRGFITVGGRLFNHYDIRKSIEEKPGSKRTLLTEDGIFINDRSTSKEELAGALGFPGEELVVHPGIVIRNGKQLQGSFAEDPDNDYGPVVVEPNTLLVVGDNLNNSSDSRAWGLLEKDRVLGKAIMIYRPWSRIRLLK
jgi:signal peptidase I